MKDSLQLLKDILMGRNWDAAILAADHLLADGELTADQKSFCYYAKCRALSNLDRFSAALEPGQRALYLASEGGNIDLLGRCLLEVAFVQQFLKMYQEAAQSYERWLAIKDKLPAETSTSQRFDVLINVGVNYRAAGDFRTALNYFLEAWELGSGAPDISAEKVEDARCRAVWEALTLAELEVVSRLLPYGDDYFAAHPTDSRSRSRQLVHLARLSLLQGDVASATGYAGNAISLAEKDLDILSSAFVVLYDVDKGLGDADSAMTSGILALRAAERAGLHEEVANLRADLNRLWMQFPEEVVKSVTGSLAWRDPSQHVRR